MANRARPLAPPPDNYQIVSFVSAEYTRRSTPEEAHRNVCEVIQYMREHPNEVLDMARGPVQPAEQPKAEPEAPRAEEPKPDDSEQVEREKEPERDLKRSQHSPVDQSEPKRAKLEEHDPQEGTSSQFHLPPPPSESAGSRDMDIEDDDEEDPVDVSDPDIHAEHDPQEGTSSQYHGPLPKTPEHDSQEGTSSQNHSPPESDAPGADESVDRPEEVQRADISNWEGAEYFDNVLRQNEEDDASSVGSEGYSDTDVDSDDYAVEDPDELDDDDEMLDEYVAPFGEFSIDVVRETYRIMARKEFKHAIQYPLGVADISRILHLRRFTRIKLINLPIDSIEVTIGYRYIIFKIRHVPSGMDNIIQYVSHEDGCRFQHNNMSILVRGVKYQTLAANDFFYLVRHPDLRLQKLIIDIVDYETPRVYPFQSFFWKISNYFESSESLQLKVSEFSITTFYHDNDGDRARDFIEIFWFKLAPEVLETAILRVWDDEFVRERLEYETPPDRNLTKKLYDNEQWRNLKKLNTFDENIVINPHEYTHFTHLDEHFVFLPRDDTEYNHFKHISVAFGALEPLEDKVTRCVVVPSYFSVQEAGDMFLRERILDHRTISYSEPHKVFMALLPNGASLEVTGPLRRKEHVIKKITFTLPLKPEILKKILEEKEKKWKEDFELNKDTLPGRPLKHK